jgi:drug/metabolite transporter (DMT)-like permease
MLYAIVSAFLFGMNTPLAKLLLDGVDPIVFAGLLYLGAGITQGLGLIVSAAGRRREARLERADLPWLAGAILAGGVAGPILLLLGLRVTPAATASLLLNFEVVATGVVAAVLFGEATGWRTWAAIASVSVGGALLAVDPAQAWGISLGALLILAACFSWGLDNNCTGRISLKDPRKIVYIKGLAAGGVSLLLGLALRRPLPGWDVVLLALLLGAVSYGLSIVFFVRAQRAIGTARTGAIYGMAPFVGTALSLLIFREIPTVLFYAALPLMALAVVLLGMEKHAHEHTHEDLAHSHRHWHDDDHHAHDHSGADSSELQLPHEHVGLSHSHPHRPDPHHRHIH